VRLDQNMAKVSVQFFMPLILQLFSKQAGIRPPIKLLALLLWHTVSATVNSIGMACSVHVWMLVSISEQTLKCFDAKCTN